MLRARYLFKVPAQPTPIRDLATKQLHLIVRKGEGSGKYSADKEKDNVGSFGEAKAMGGDTVFNVY